MIAAVSYGMGDTQLNAWTDSALRPRNGGTLSVLGLEAHDLNINRAPWRR
jgi:hypothetical protein